MEEEADPYETLNILLLSGKKLKEVPEQILNVKFCVLLSKSSTETFEMLNKVYKEQTMSMEAMLYWHSRFYEDLKDKLPIIKTQTSKCSKKPVRKTKTVKVNKEVKRQNGKKRKLRSAKNEIPVISVLSVDEIKQEPGDVESQDNDFSFDLVNDDCELNTETSTKKKSKRKEKEEQSNMR